MPTFLFLIVLLATVSLSLLFYLRYGLGRSLCLAGYILLAISLLSFLFFLSIDPGYGWVRSSDLRKNHITVFIFIGLFIVSLGLIILGRQTSTSSPGGHGISGNPALTGKSIPARRNIMKADPCSISHDRVTDRLDVFSIGFGRDCKAAVRLEHRHGLQPGLFQPFTVVTGAALGHHLNGIVIQF